MNATSLEKLKKKLPKNYVLALISATGCSRITIWRVLNGRPSRSFRKVIDAAIKLAAENAEAIREQEEKIKKL